VSFAEYGETHERALAYMRWRRDDAVASESSIQPSAEMAGDARLMRFLIAKSFDCKGAADMYIDALRWRRDAKMDAHREALRAANAPFFTDGAPALQALPGADMLAGVQPRMFTRRASDGGGGGELELLTDRQGNLVYIECPGLIVPADVLALDAAEYTAAVHRAQELLQLVLDELSRRARRLVLILRVIDMQEVRRRCPPCARSAHETHDAARAHTTRRTHATARTRHGTHPHSPLSCVGLSSGQVRLMAFMRSRAEKEGERLVKEASKPFADAYPTTTYKNFLINLPAAAGAAAPLIKAFVPARSAKKVVLLGSKFVDELHREVDPSMLPRALGGVLDDGSQWERRGKK
jgi:hypothetical protein